MATKSSNKRWTLECLIFLMKYYPSDYTIWNDDKIPTDSQISGHIFNLSAVMDRTAAASSRMITRICNGSDNMENTLDRGNLFYSSNSSENAFEKFIENAEYLDCKKEASILIESHSDAYRSSSKEGRIKLSDSDMRLAKKIVDRSGDSPKKQKTPKKKTPAPKNTVQVTETQGQKVYKVVKETVTETTYYYKEEDKAFKSLV